MLQIKDLKASIGKSEILRGLTLDVNAGEVHAIMGPPGSGPRPLAQVVAQDDLSVATNGEGVGDARHTAFPQVRLRSGVIARDGLQRAPAEGLVPAHSLEIAHRAASPPLDVAVPFQQLPAVDGGQRPERYGGRVEVRRIEPT